MFSFLRQLSSLALLSAFFLSGIDAAAVTDSLQIATTSGIFLGTADTSNDTESWLGIPYAQPPIGSLRFKAPVPIDDFSSEIQDASHFGDACPQIPTSSLGANMSENCLTLNIWRPNGTEADAKLPVMVWIYGGGFMDGSASDPSYNPTRIVQLSASIGKPIVFVSLNYRVNTFGFLASAYVPPEDLNAGLLDQRAALLYLQDNIANFGGDPAKVTIWGQSAGAGGVEAQVLFSPEPVPFRAAIADSSTGPFKNAPYAYQYDEPGEPYSRLLEATGCPSGPYSFTCLQDVPYDVLLPISNRMADETVNTQLWEPTVAAGSFVPERPSDRILSGNFAHVPYLGGTNLNEGTIFSSNVYDLNLPSSEQTSAFNYWISELLVDNRTLTTSVLDGINEYFPTNDSTYGGPWHTGDMLFDKAETWYTDNMFVAPRRYFYSVAAALQPIYGYWFTEFIPGNNPTLGVYHGSELTLIFGPVPDLTENNFANQLTTYWINFVNDMTPGDDWPQYDESSKLVLQLHRDNITAIPDTFDLDRTDYLNTPAVLDVFEK